MDSDPEINSFRMSQVLQATWSALRNNRGALGRLAGLTGVPVGFLLVVFAIESSGVSQSMEYFGCILISASESQELLSCETTYSANWQPLPAFFRYVYFVILRASVIGFIVLSLTTQPKTAPPLRRMTHSLEVQFTHRSYWIGVLRIVAIDLAMVIVLFSVSGALFAAFSLWRLGSSIPAPLGPYFWILVRIIPIMCIISAIGALFVVLRWSLGSILTVTNGSRIYDSLCASWHLTTSSWPKLLAIIAILFIAQCVLLVVSSIFLNGAAESAIYFLIELLMHTLLATTLTVFYNLSVTITTLDNG